MKTTAEQLLFTNLDEAQEILDDQDPGYEIYISSTGNAVVLDEHGEIALRVLAEDA
jgi:hypothetical protein